MERLIGRIRRCLTEIEVEQQTKHPATPDFEYCLKQLSFIEDTLPQVKEHLLRDKSQCGA